MTDDATTILLDDGSVLVFERPLKEPIKGIEMTDELTLREKVAQSVAANPNVFSEDPIKRHQAASPMRVDVKQQEAFSVVDAIATILEDTGAPAHMRVAAELRGE